MKAQQTQQYLPYMGMEFHLAESVRTHREKPDTSQAHFEASGLFQEAQIEKDFDKKKIKIQAYKTFCKKNGIKCFTMKDKVKV